MLDENGYYSLRAMLGYPAKYYIVLSDRGRGKSWGTKHFLMRQDGQFMCLYRQTPDMVSAIESWLTPFAESGAFSIDAFQWDGNDKEGYQLLYNGEVKGYFRCLTQVNHIKQEVFPDTLNWVWLDEFIPLVYKKLPGVSSEGDAIRTIVKTIEHDTVHSREDKGLKPVRVLLYGNPFNWNNPILSYFKINGLLGPGIHKAGPGVVWELLEPYEQPRKDNKMTVDDFLGDEVNRNMGFMDQGAFVEPIPKGSTPAMSIRFRDKYFLIMQHGKRYYVKRTTEHRDVIRAYSANLRIVHKYGTLDGLQEDETSIEVSKMGRMLRDKAWNGLLRYEDINCKFDFLNSITDVIR